MKSVAKTPLVTVVTITYNLKKANREQFIRQNIESVYNQTYKNIEHIIIDGASNDGTLEIFKDYPWLKVFSEPDEGIYYAMNKGIEKAKGKYIAFLNSDDFWHNKSGIEKSVKLLEKYNADYSFSDITSINIKTDKPCGNWYATIENLPFGMHYCHQGMLTKADVLREFGGFDTSYKVSSDSDFEIKLCKFNKKWIKVPLNYTSYRDGGISCSQSETCRNDHSLSFYKHFGKEFGLTLEECRNIWTFCKCDDELYAKYKKTGIDKMLQNTSAKKMSKIEQIFGRYKECTLGDYKFAERIFSLKNSMWRKYKIIMILGFPIIIKNRFKGRKKSN